MTTGVDFTYITKNEANTVFIIKLYTVDSFYLELFSLHTACKGRIPFSADPDMVPEDISAESIVDVDNDVIATAPVITDDDILEQLQKDHSPESDEEDGCDDESLNDEVPERPSRSQVESALGVLKNASLFSNTGEEMQCVIFKFESLFTKKRHYRVFFYSTSSLYLLLCNAFNSYKKLIYCSSYKHISFSHSVFLRFTNFSLSRTLSLSRTNPLVPYKFEIESVHCTIKQFGDVTNK